MKKFVLFRFIANFFKNWIYPVLGICIVMIFNVTSAQTVYHAGKYFLLLEDGTYYDISGPDTCKVTTNHMAIKLRDGISENERSEFLSHHPLSYSGMGTIADVIIFNIDSLANFVTLIENIANDPDVELYDINQLIKLADVDRPNDAYWDIFIQIGIHENLLWPYNHTGLFEAWNIENGDSSIIVAEIDNGIWIDHPDISFGPDNYSNLWNNYDEIYGIPNYDDDGNEFEDDFHGWNFTEGNNDIMHDNISADNGTHGTILSGIIAAKTNNTLGIWGTAGGYSDPGIKILPVKCSSYSIPGELETDLIIAGIKYAVNAGARIINMPFATKNHNSALYRTIHEYYDQNIIFLAPSGNYNQDTVLFPANYEEVIAVGASHCDKDDTQAEEYRWGGFVPEYGSNYGYNLDLVAPGGLFISNVISQNGQLQPVYIYKTYDFPQEKNVSTSRAVSFASGVVALMLSANPCLTNVEVNEILTSTADKISPEENDYDEVTGWSFMVGYGRINALKALQPVIIPPIEVNTTWNSDMKIYNEINVEDGAELTIENCTISMSNWAKIIVKPGGTLILNNCTLTGICGSIMWPGIEVWGNKLASQYTEGAQGKLILRNGATIENAVTAVELWHPGVDNSTGGIIDAIDAIFLNNARSIHAKDYKNFNPYVPAQELGYLGTFTNCSFEISNQYLGDQTFYKHVDLDRVRGFEFYGCTFSLSHNASNVSEWNLGIAAYNAGFYVKPHCPSHTKPCEDTDSSQFSGFYRGIGSFTSDATPHPTFINSARFDDNAIGVYLSGTNYPFVLGNYFEVGYDNGTTGHCGFANGIGIDVNVANGFCIENNKIRKNFSAPTGIYAGIGVQNCPSAHDIIYKNELTGLSYGNYAEGTNRLYSNNDATGVEYNCCYNLENAIDFIIIDDVPRYAMIRGQQGSQDTASGNTFSPSATWHVWNGGTQTIFWYYFDDSPSSIDNPIYVHTYQDNPLYFKKDIAVIANDCPDHYGGSGHIKLTSEERLEKEVLFAENSINLQLTNALYESLIDGGNTETELSDIESSEPDDMWALRTQLLGHSPHLSQEVLRAMADRTDVFPDEVLLEILSANPDELNRDTLISFLEQKEDPLPEYMIGILRQAVSGTTYKTILEDEMAQYHAAKIQAAQDIIRSILFDTVFNMTDYRNWLDNMDNMVADRQIIASYLSENDTANAIALLNILPSLYNLEGESLADHNTYKSMVELQIQWLAENKNISELDSTDIILLESMAEDSTTIAGNMARNILTYAYDHYYCNCLEMPDSTYLKNDFIHITHPNPGNEILKISAEPNPAHAFVAFDYELLKETSTGQILISDLNGKRIWQIQVNGKQGQKVWNTTEIKAGVYYYSLLSDGISKAGKIVIH